MQLQIASYRFVVGKTVERRTCESVVAGSGQVVDTDAAVVADIVAVSAVVDTAEAPAVADIVAVVAVDTVVAAVAVDIDFLLAVVVVVVVVVMMIGELPPDSRKELLPSAQTKRIHCLCSGPLYFFDYLVM
jgi:hypothetical protein